MADRDEDRVDVISRSVRVAVLGVLAALGIVALVLLRDPHQVLSNLAADQANVHLLVARLGVAAPVAFVLGYATLMLLLWLPAWPCTIVGGFLFGPWLAVPYSLAGATVGAMAVFALAKGGFAGLTKQAAPAVRRFEADFNQNAFAYIVALRVAPIVPFSVVNLAAAVLGVPLRTFALATLIGIVPSTTIYAILGGELAELARRGPIIGLSAVWQARVLVPLLCLAALALAPAVYRHVRRGANAEIGSRDAG